MSTPADDPEPKLAIELLAAQPMIDESGDRVGDDGDDLDLDDIYSLGHPDGYTIIASTLRPIAWSTHPISPNASI